MLGTGINFNKFGYEYSDADTLKCIRDAGFDSVFTGFWDDEKTAVFKDTSARLGLRYESIHAPFGGINCMWDEGEKGDEYVRRLCAVADTCARFDIGYFTLHCMNVPEFNVDVTAPLKWSQLGLDRFARVVEYAGERGVKACFENVEFPQFELKGLLENLCARGYTSLGWTWDVGHEHCYSAPDFDLTAHFGEMLTGTHVHDNFGQSDPHVVTWNDDSHILPFDGTIDFRRVGRELKKCGYAGTITLETGRKPMVPWYRDMKIDEFLAVAHERAVRIALWYEEAT